MDIEEEVKELIDCHGEGDYLDFKEYDYHKENKEELVKDIIAFANSHSDRNKYIIIGAIEENNVCIEIRGIDKSTIRDEAEFQQIVNTYIYENLIVNYKIITIDEKDVLVIQIPATNNDNRPFMVKKQIGKLKENEVFIRKGSMTMLANKKDLKNMFKENKSSKLVIQSYLNGKLSNKILMTDLNSKVERYRKEKFNNLQQRVSEINKLKGGNFSFVEGMSFFIKDEKVKIEEDQEEFIKQQLKELKIEYNDEIFEFKNIRWKTTFNGGGLYPVRQELYGDKNEIERYWRLKDLDSFILEYLAINYYTKGLPQIYTTNLVISNIGNYFDEDIELKLIIDKELFIKKETIIVDDDVIKYLGNMYQDLKEDFIECPRVSNVDEYFYPSIVHNNITSHIPTNVGAMISYEPTYLDKLNEKAEDFKDDIDNIFEDSIYEENDKIIIKVDFKKIMQNKSMFLEAKLLFNSNEIKIDYEITSKNSSKTTYGIIET